MCFSPEASFASGIIISTIGVATVKKVQKPSELMFAGIPLFFGVQQIAEGFLWLILPYPEHGYVQKLSTYIFLIMAEVLWPVIMPLAVLFMEENNKRKKNIVESTGYGFISVIVLCFLFIIFQCNAANNGLSYSV